MSGFALPGNASGSQDVTGMELLTGDTNILSIALVLQYVVGNPADFLFHVEAPQALVDTVAQDVLTEAVAAMPIDEVLTTGRVAMQEKVKTGTQEILDRYQSGERDHLGEHHGNDARSLGRRGISGRGQRDG